VELAETCTSVCRMMRNLCAACPEGQARVRREGVLKLFIVIVHICCAYYERPLVGKDPAVVDTLLAAGWCLYTPYTLPDTLTPTLYLTL
jgi:hypothetical protein